MTNIEWCDETWNPIIGCRKVSPGCANCYAERMAWRLAHTRHSGEAYSTVTAEGGRWNGDVYLREDVLAQPLHWRKPRIIFACSMSDPFYEKVPDEWIDCLFDTMWLAHHHTFIILTKRVERMVGYVKARAHARSFGWTDLDRPMMHPGFVLHMDDMVMRDQCGYYGARDTCQHPSRATEGDKPPCLSCECPIASCVDDREGLRKIGVAREYTFDPDGFTDESQWMRLHARPRYAAARNVILGFSAEDQATHDDRMSWFRQLRNILGPEAVFYASLEPLLGPIDFDETGPCDRVTFEHGTQRRSVPCLQGVIVGGETGPGARPMKPEWVRSIRDQCAEAGVPFFFKGWGDFSRRKEKRQLDGREHNDLPWGRSDAR